MNKFINKLLLLVLSIGIGTSYGMHDPSPADRYLSFLANVSPSSGKNAFSDMASLFAQTCCKVVNGKIKCKDLEELQAQLSQAQQDFGHWTVKAYQENCISFPEDKTYVLQFDVGNAQINLIVIKFITFDDVGLITCINEIYATKADNATDTYSKDNQFSQNLDSVALKDAGRRYIEFLQNFGKPGHQDLNDEMNAIISSECIKILNGGLVSKDIHEFETQLIEAKGAFGSWTIELDEEYLKANSEENICIVKCNLTTEKTDTTYTAILYLRFNEAGQIKEINEVYNQKES